MITIACAFFAGALSIIVYAYSMVASARSLPLTVAFQVGTLLGGIAGSYIAGRVK